MQFGEESYEKANDDQTAVERKSNIAKRKAKHGRAFEFDEEVQPTILRSEVQWALRGFLLKNDGASKTTLLRSATQFAHTCASVGEGGASADGVLFQIAPPRATPSNHGKERAAPARNFREL